MLMMVVVREGGEEEASNDDAWEGMRGVGEEMMKKKKADDGEGEGCFAVSYWGCGCVEKMEVEEEEEGGLAARQR